MHGSEVFEFGFDDIVPEAFDVFEGAQFLCRFFSIVGSYELAGFVAEPLDFVVDHAFPDLTVGFADGGAQGKVRTGCVFGWDAGDVDAVGFEGPQE